MSLPVIDVVIKFGGSSITDKSHLESLKSGQLEKACLCIKKCQDAGLTCLVVHGAGSYGHHQAKQYGVNRGLNDPSVPDKDKLWGYVLTRQSVTKLNKLVVDHLIQNGVNAVGCSSMAFMHSAPQKQRIVSCPFQSAFGSQHYPLHNETSRITNLHPGSSWKTDMRKPIKWASEEIAEFFRMGLVPVFHGDCCIDESLGCCILSGDTIIQSVCSLFEVKRVLFLTDVDGVFDRPPEQSGAKLLKTVSVNKDGSLQSNIQVSDSQYDVTGGIQLKLQTAVDIILSSRTHCPVYVCGIDSTEAEILCLRGRKNGEDLNATELSLSE